MLKPGSTNGPTPWTAPAAAITAKARIDADPPRTPKRNAAHTRTGATR